MANACWRSCALEPAVPKSLAGHGAGRLGPGQTDKRTDWPLDLFRVIVNVQVTLQREGSCGRVPSSPCWCWGRGAAAQESPSPGSFSCRGPLEGPP